MSFRADFVNKIKQRYTDDIGKRRSIEADWVKVRGYFVTLMEDISDVSEFALAKFEENDKELWLSIEGHELSFRKSREAISVFVNSEPIDDFWPTTEGYCLNFKEEKIMQSIDHYMMLTFRNVLEDSL